MSKFHNPVMLAECIDFLALKPGAIYVDTTTGGGGHSAAMLKACPQIKLYCLDQDEEALAEAKKTFRSLPGQENVELIKANFSNLRTQLAYRGVKSIDGILFDLGISSHQIDTPERGFSFDKAALLDMRMDKSHGYTAADAIRQLELRELTRIFREYGEEQQAYAIAKAIKNSDIEFKTTTDLALLIESVVGKGTKDSLKCKVRIFQALRIHVNGELDCLRQGLDDAINLLAPQGRIVVISYHSLEDRIVKQRFAMAARDCICEPGSIQCHCDHHKQLKLLTKSPQIATEEELATNSRSRSAKLRAAEKLDRHTKIIHHEKYNKPVKREA